MLKFGGHFEKGVAMVPTHDVTLRFLHRIPPPPPTPITYQVFLWKGILQRLATLINNVKYKLKAWSHSPAGVSGW